MLQKCRSQLASRFRFRLNQCIPVPDNCICLHCLSDIRSSDKPCCQKRDHNPSRQNSGGHNLGGSGCKLYNFSLIGDHLISDPSLVSQESMFRYVAHVDDVGLLAYSSAQFVHTNIPLCELFKFLPVSHAWKVASIHCIPAGSCCNIAELLTHVENHSCLRCSSYLTVFSVEMNNKQLNSKCVAKCREQKPKLPENKSTVPKAPMVSEFPPAPASSDLTNSILSKACKKMHPEAIGEAGCAVCGELKQMSRLKGIKNLLGILEAPGVTRVERNRSDAWIKSILVLFWITHAPKSVTPAKRMLEKVRFHALH